MKIFGREPALILGLFAAFLQLLSSTVLDLSVDQQGVLNAVAVAVVGFATAYSVARDKLAPAILGLVQSVLASSLAFGLDLAPEVQGSIMAFASAATAAFVRTQVTASVPESVEPGVA